MIEKRVQFNDIVKNQLPQYVREEFPLVSEFLSQYYLSQEYQGGAVDLIQNIDNYIKLNEITNLNQSVILEGPISFDNETINIDLDNSPKGTSGFPDSYGLLKIGDEIITYTGKTSSSFTGCIRGFSGVSSYQKIDNPEELVFKSTLALEHSKGSIIKNLSVLFLNEFLKKIKRQFLPGFEDRSLAVRKIPRVAGGPTNDFPLDQNIFIKQSKDFYSSKGTDQSFKILFSALYGENVEIIKPREFLFRPSDAGYKITNDLVVESISGNPFELRNLTLKQDTYGNINAANAPITKVEKVNVGVNTNSYYQISLDSGYDRDIIVDGAIYGKFSVHPKTKVIGQVSIGQTYIDVDSTVGFPQSGELFVQYPSGNSGIISYKSKSFTQFFQCTNNTETIPDNTSIDINTFAYSFAGIGSTNQIKIKIRSVLNSLNINNSGYYHTPGETIKIKTLGISPKEKSLNNWYFNTATTFNVKNIKLVGSKNYEITLFDMHSFRVNDRITITSSDNSSYSFTITNILSSRIFNCEGPTTLNMTLSFTVKRNRLKTSSTKYPINNFDANVQNTYQLKDKTLVSSSSLPYYSKSIDPQILSYTLDGLVGAGNTFTITSGVDHGFYTGDAVYYTPQKNGETIISSLFDEGIYYVKRVDQNRIQLSRSRSNIFNKIFVTLDSEKFITNNKIEILRFKEKSLTHQKLLREISNPVNDRKIHATLPGQTGIFVNGVEVLNYKSKDSVYYGDIEEVEVISGGQNYDIVNPPQLIIQDAIGVGATGYCSIKGFLKEIRISDPGFDYSETPKVIISGGNGANATAEAILTDTLHEVSFNSEEKSGIVNITNNTLGFTTYHKFRNNELIIYKTFSQDGISGLTTDSKYYVSVQNSTTVKLHKTFNDSVLGINTISLTGYGKGNHSLEAFNKKKLVSSIVVMNNGSGYENKKRTCSSVGIDTSLNTITIKNHGYNSGEIVTYSVDGSSASGLSTTSRYYVTKLTDNTFKLSNVGLTTDSLDFFYKTKQYVDIDSVGVGTHIFNYPNITVDIVGNIGIASISNQQFKCTVQPIFQGEITSVHLINGGVGYGSSDIINFFREPSIEVYSGSGATLYPIVVDGKISEVLVNDNGDSYTSPPKIIIDGDGTGASLTPILTNGQITSVKIINSGKGYSQNLTTLKIVSPGSGVKFKTKIKTWTINLFKKYFDILNEDDGVLVEALNKDYGVQYCHLYAPRELRKTSYASDISGNPLYLEPDLNTLNNTEIISSTTNQNHSPIIGWAYDGNPIYGPYGYATKNGGGLIVKMKSGYKQSLKSNRPSFPSEFFVEDFDFLPSDDETVLDENNGRFCKTPDFPNGVYAYFATFEDSLDQGGIFGGYRRPKFPYLIGKNYHSSPNKFNFNPASNQDKYNLNTSSWLRNSSSYNFNEENSNYDYLIFPNKFKEQTSQIKTTSVGSVESIGIITGGLNYKVNDKILLNPSNTKGQGFSAKVSRLSGKEVSSVSLSSTTINNIEFYPLNGDGSFIGFSSLPHGLNDFDLIRISGLSTTSSFIEGSYRAGITTNKLLVVGVGTTSLGISSTGITGIVTYIPVTGNLFYPNIKENDILQIENEKVKVLNIDPVSSRIRVLRQIDGTVGSAHTANTPIFEISKKFNVNSGYSTTFSNLRNKEIYFNPKESVGLGTISGVGIGSTLTFSNPGAGITQTFISTKTIYLPDHRLETGDSLIYNSNGGSTIAISTNGISSINVSDGATFFVAKLTSDLIGISTVKVGLGTTGTFVGIASTTSSQSTVFFTGIGTGVYHSFKTNYSNILTGRIDKNIAIVSTAETHGLTTGDNITISVNPSIATTFYVKYNEYNRRITVNSKTFASANIDIEKNSINISNHDLYNGQVAIHTSSSPSGGLQNNKIYYVYVVDEDTIKLTETLYDSTSSKPSIVNITSSSSGTLSLVNPPIDIYRNSTIHFDLSDPSLFHRQGTLTVASFDFNIFTDKNFSKKYERIENNNLVVEKIGTAGVSTSVKVSVTINKNTPQLLFYNLTPANLISIPTNKKEIVIDTDAYQNNTIFVNDSLYTGSYDVTVSTGSTFTYNLLEHPESTEYTKNNSLIKYDTNSITAFGPIEDIDIVSKGFGFDVIPGISTISSKTGSNALLEPQSSSIGIIKKVKIENIGFDYSADSTVRPIAKIPQVLKVKPLSSFDSVGVTSVGIGYITAPKLIVIDGNTRKPVLDIDLRYNTENDTVTILKNTKGLFAVNPTIIPTQNCNGVGISSVSYNPATKDVTAFLSVGFTTVGGFPFSVNDKVLIENVGIKTVGAGSTYKGYNSENYNYELFKIKSINPNYGGLGASIVYNLTGLLSSGEEPGEFDSAKSSGRAIPEKHFPIFNVKLKINDFFIGEEVSILGDNNIGKLIRWNPITEYVSIESGEDFEVGRIILGRSSNSQALIKESINYDSDYTLDSFSKVLGNWSYNAGFLNENSQRIQDSFYYQNFSYSLKSTVDYDTWEDAVSNLNHTAGFKKFSDYQLESKLFNPNSMIVGLTTNTTDIDLKIDLTGIVDLNCVYNFDLVRENALNINSNLVSNEIIFNSAILNDYFESVGNRVLLIDDISSQFNSNPRSLQYSIIHRTPVSFARVQKYIIYTRDTRYTDERQLTIASFLIDNNNLTYLNQYGLEGIDDLGYYDVVIDGTDVILQFYPIKYEVNDYDVTTISYNLKDTLSSVGNINFGCVSIASSSIFVSAGTTTTIVGIATTYTSSKILVEMGTPTGLYQYDEISLVHDGTNVQILEFGKLNNLSNEDYVGAGIGTYNAYISGSNVNLDFKPNPGIAATVNLINVSIADTSSTGIGTYQMRHVLISSTSTSIASTSSPTANVVGTYPETAGAAYFIVQVSDITNNRHQMSEVLVIDNETHSQTFQTEYGVVATFAGLGTIGSVNSTITNLTFTPLPNIDVAVKVYMNAFTFDEVGNLPDQIDLNNAIIETDFSNYYGTETDIKRAFGLTYETKPIFVRDFLGNSNTIVDITKDTVTIPNHFFVTGEKLSYSSAGINSNQSIGIATTSVVGLGTTDKLPSTIYVVKIDEKTLKFAESSENALKAIPVTFDLTSVGIGTSHTLYAHNQNNKVLIALDNNIQSPIVSTSQTTTLAGGVSSIDDIIYFTGITSFFGGDLIRIGSEILRIDGVGIGSTNGIRVKRSWLGTNYAGYSTGSLVTKVVGDYNIVGNSINFVTAPYGNIPLTTSTAAPDSRYWLGVSTSSKFHGRMFMRSGEINGTNETYYKNYIFDDISGSFTGIANTFSLKSSGSNITGISTSNGVILINEIFQNAGATQNYVLSESSGETKITFVGTAKSIGYDVGISSFPRGGIIISVGSSAGFGYQPLVAAGGTAIVSAAGTIQSISIGNSGSGYRVGVQTVRVGVATSTTNVPSIHFIGTATVSNGNIVSVAVTNPGIGYTISNPPYVIFDYPLSYSNIPLVYASGSIPGIGQSASINVVVGQGSSVIDFELQSTGFGYGQGESLTLPIGGSTGIPTTSGYVPFTITIEKTINDKFSGWSVGDLDVLDSFDDLFDGDRRIFALKKAGETVSIIAAPGSSVKVDYTLLIFINDILQIPGEGYTFRGGNIITFTEAPKEGDTSKVIFYKGSGSIDVIKREVLDTVKIGDTLTISYSPSLNQTEILQEEERVVTSIDSVNVVSTNPYYGPGNINDPDLSRPVVWCRQMEDLFIDSKIVGKNRELYEASINPSAYLIKSVGVGSTEIFVDNVRPFFNPINETNAGGSDPFVFQRDIIIVSQDTKVSAAATSIVSVAGTISSIVISDGGVGYTTTPSVSIAGTTGVGIGTTVTALALATISNGSIVSIAITNPGFGYTSSNPPIVLIESPDNTVENNRIVSYEKDFGIISGISTTSVGVASTGLVFDLLISKDSFLRDSDVTGVTTVSGIQTGYYFVVYNSNVGNGVTSLNSDGSVIGVGTTCLDNVYRVSSVSIAQTHTVGFGLTYVAKVTVSLSNYNSLTGLGFSSFYGEYSWGKLTLSTRTDLNVFNAYTQNGVTGIRTGSLISRKNPLKYQNYIL